MAERDRNLWERQQNKRAKAKKDRAKAKHFGKEDEGVQWDGAEEQFEGARVGIIAESRQKTFSVMENDEYFQCKLGSGLDKQLSKHLVVGDKVYFEQEGEEDGSILGRQDRKSTISRLRGDSTRYSEASLETHVIASNVDDAVIVASAKDPEFHSRFIDRYLIVCQNGHVEPIMCINKSDLTTERHPALAFYRELGIRIVETSTLTEEGIEELKNLIRGRIVVLVGNSGVGKSTLINKIIPGADLRTTEVSEKKGTGKHTTTASNLYKWDEGSYVIDTPGIRSLGIDNIEKSSIRFFFPEFENFADHCKFRDCVHDHEPECEVKKAVERGDINVYRYESYLRMLKEY